MKQKTYVLTFAYLTLLASVFAFDHKAQTLGSGIDWSKGVIISKAKAFVEYNDAGAPVDPETGQAIQINKARKDIYNFAKERAVLEIAQAVKNLRIDPEKNMTDLFGESPLTSEKVSNVISSYLSFKQYPAGYDASVCEARLKFGNLIAAINYEFPNNDFPSDATVPISTEYTSLIINCKDLNIKPMLFPSVYADDGMEIYGRQFIDVNIASRESLVVYCSTPEQAMKHRRAGQHPYYTAALKNLRDCPVISEKDRRRIFSSKSTISNLKNCRVIFILE